jgi:hypothetical protein
LHSYGLPEGYNKLVVGDIIVLLIDALKGIGATDNKLLQAHTKADHHNPSSGHQCHTTADGLTSTRPGFGLGSLMAPPCLDNDGSAAR